MRIDVGRPRPGRRVGYHHFALFRGHLDGLALDRLGDLYLETGTDLRHAKRTLRWIRDELVAAAARYQAETGVTQASLSRLLRIEPGRLKPEERLQLAEAPSLEDFQGEFDPGGFYDERELIAEFEKRYGGAQSALPPVLMRRVARNDRLRRRIRRAVDTLEAWIAGTPKPTDPIAIWLEPVVVDRLAPAGIVSIDDLVGLINRRGHRWHSRIPKLGSVRAARIVRWLQNSRVKPIEERALTPYRQFGAGGAGARQYAIGEDREDSAVRKDLVPLERLVLPSDLSGLLGTNRGAECQLPSVRDDRDAIRAWLDLKGANARTRRAYSGEVERFVLWLVHEKGRALSSASPEDCHEYIQFLSALATPGAAWPWRMTRAQWIGPKYPRWSAEWKPFTGRLSERSRAMAVNILRGMFATLVDVGYLRWNPFLPVKTPKFSGGRIKTDHRLNARQWQAVTAALDAMPRDERYFRLRFLLDVGYGGGLRQEEMVSLTANHLVRTPEGDWNLVFAGKAGREREVPLPKVVFGHLQDYMDARGHGTHPLEWQAKRIVVRDRFNREREQGLPLLTALGSDLQQVQKEKDRPLSARTVAQILKAHFDLAAENIDDIIDASELRRASTHWLRHTAATELIEKGASVTETQEILGHRSVATTSLYVHADRKKKRAAIERLFK